jgi:hypothetical protein
MEIRKELLDELIKDYKKPEDLIGETDSSSSPKRWWKGL